MKDSNRNEFVNRLRRWAAGERLGGDYGYNSPHSLQDDIASLLAMSDELVEVVGRVVEYAPLILEEAGTCEEEEDWFAHCRAVVSKYVPTLPAPPTKEMSRDE